MQRILVLGAKEIDFSRIINVTHSVLNKPDFGSGCLWGSTLIKYSSCNIGSSWKEYVANIYEDKDFDYGVSFKLHKNSKILEIANLNDYKNIMKQYSCLANHYDSKYCLDFVKISKEYDAFHLTEDAFWSMRLPMFNNPACELYDLNYDNFYSYDAESWIIFNLNAINKGSILNHNNVVASWEGEYDEE